MQRFPNSRSVISKLKAICEIDTANPVLYNRNPKNLEKLKIAYNNNGFYLEKPGKSFYNKLVIEPSGKYVTAKVVHVHDGPIIEASTKEWAIKKQLVKTSNTSAFMNLARIFSDRCLKFGIYELRWDDQKEDNMKIGLFLSVLKENGIVLTGSFDRVDPNKPRNYKFLNSATSQ